MSNQAPDWLLFRGGQRMLLNTPLESLLRRTARPDFHLHGPDNRRGYVAQWEIRLDDSLWLTHILSQPEEWGSNPNLRVLFPNANGPVAATWVSQMLRVPDTCQRRFEPVGCSSPYARESFLSICNGHLIMIENIDTRSGRIIETEFKSGLERLFGSEEGAFLRGIRVEPEDTAPRLIFADWLDERGDPRGEVLRQAERLRHFPECANQSLFKNDPEPAHWLWLRIVAHSSSALELV